MKLLKNTPETIVFPLLVMLLLTALVGLTTFQLTNAWRKTTEKTVHSAVESVMLVNIRWKLSEVKYKLSTQPKQVLQDWDDAARQVNLLVKSNPDNLQYVMLQSFLAKPENINHIDDLFRQSFFNPDLGKTQEELHQFQRYSQFVTMAITACMLVLGGILILMTVWDLRRLVTGLVQSRDLNIRVQEEERQRIAQDLHDGAVQELIDLKRDYSPQKVDRLIHTLRRVCHNLKPQVLDDLGLASALEFLADELREAAEAENHIQVDVNMDTEGLALLPKVYELPLFRVVQELCSNIKRHAQATHVTLTILYNPEESPLLRGYVSDNGQGFILGKNNVGSMGLAGVRERIQQVDGRLQIETAPGKGSQFQFYIPVKQTDKKLRQAEKK